MNKALAVPQAVRLVEVEKRFGAPDASLEVIRKLSLTFAPKSFTALLGPSGCGKSTLLRMIAGLEPLSSGQIEISRTQGGTAFVFQDAHLLPWRKVMGNVMLPLELKGVGRAEREARALKTLTMVGLADSLDLYPAELSGGMKMRVSLARALVTEPCLLLLDEPFAALDEVIRFRLAELLHRLWKDRGMTTLFVTHSTSEAAFLAERAIVFSKRPATVVMDRTLKLPEHRTADLRTTLEFVNEVRTLSQALEVTK